MPDIVKHEDQVSILQRLLGINEIEVFSDFGVSREEQLAGIDAALDEIKGACKSGDAFSMPDGSIVKDFPAIMLHHSPTRTLFKPSREWPDSLIKAVSDMGTGVNLSTIEFMADNIPACASKDGKIPDTRVTNPISKSCATCPLARFYEVDDFHGSICPPRHIVWLMIKGSFTPVFLRLTQMSIKKTPGMLLHFVQRQVNRRGIFGTYVNVSVEKVKNGANSYGVVHFDKGDNLMPEEIKVVVAFRAQWLSAMQGVSETAPDTIID